ncbi:uncharacterized protein LOC115472178 [Microcaecilia unicolor]|uniref:Uncharacterized protein LOC115472178 n=1 Tax=Microcaecilia unicolor TaxID=1415580 RepID=A0A6P7YAX6_9AMPH|nr:uncharacterized protein LOC115472178 [Microcaecilia unicolor]
MEGDRKSSGKTELEWAFQGKKDNCQPQKKTVGQIGDWTVKQLQRHEALKQRNFERAKSALEKRAVINLQRQEYFQSLLLPKINGKIAPQSSSVQIDLQKYDNFYLDSPHEKRSFTPVLTEVRPQSVRELSAVQPKVDFPYRLSCRSTPDRALRMQKPKPLDDTWKGKRIELQHLQKWLKPMRSIPSKKHGQFVLVKLKPSCPDVPKPTPIEKRLLEARFPNYEAWYCRRWQKHGEIPGMAD